MRFRFAALHELPEELPVHSFVSVMDRTVSRAPGLFEAPSNSDRNSSDQLNVLYFPRSIRAVPPHEAGRKQPSKVLRYSSSKSMQNIDPVRGMCRRPSNLCLHIARHGFGNRSPAKCSSLQADEIFASQQCRISTPVRIARRHRGEIDVRESSTRRLAKLPE